MSTPPIETPPRDRGGAGTYSEVARQKLIESRLTPNAISLTGFVLCAVAAVLVWQEHIFWGGLAFVVGSVCDTLDGRYSRMSGKGTQFGAFLDSTLDRIEEGVVLAAVARAVLAGRQGRRGRGGRDRRAGVADGLLHARPGRGARRRVQGRHRRPRGAGCHPVGGPAAHELRASTCSSSPSTCSPALSVVTVLQRIFHVRRSSCTARRRVTQPPLRGYVARSVPTGGSRT